jgi:hypothetical protein
VRCKKEGFLRTVCACVRACCAGITWLVEVKGMGRGEKQGFACDSGRGMDWARCSREEGERGADARQMEWRGFIGRETDLWRVRKLLR